MGWGRKRARMVHFSLQEAENTGLIQEFGRSIGGAWDILAASISYCYLAFLSSVLKAMFKTQGLYMNIEYLIH